MRDAIRNGKPKISYMNYINTLPKKELRRILLGLLEEAEEAEVPSVATLDALAQIKERFPERLTDKKMHSNEQYVELTKQAYMRLADIEDIIYGEGDEK